MKLKHNISDMVYYWNHCLDAVCLGRIVSVGYDSSDIESFILYSVKNVLGDIDEDGYELSIRPEEIYTDEEDIYKCMRQGAYDWNKHDSIRCMEKEEFDRMFDEKYGG